MRVLIVEDHEHTGELLRRRLQRLELCEHVEWTDSLSAAMQYIEGPHGPGLDLLILDWALQGDHRPGDTSGRDIARSDEVRERCPNAGVIYFTGFADLPDDHHLQATDEVFAVVAKEAGAFSKLEEAVTRYHDDWTVRGSLENKGVELLGNSRAMVQLRYYLKHAADARCFPVLLQGETGVGKDVAARYLHAACEGGDGPFVAFNCAAVDRTNFYAQLFGAVGGVTHAGGPAVVGALKRADGGVLFLDEIGEMPAWLQPTLLRAVQTGEYEPLFSSRTEHSNFTLVCATNRDLRAEVQAGNFREDLYQRIRRVELYIPPLRQRPVDIPVLAAHFLKKFASPAGPAHELAPASWRALMAYPFPGNVRELQAAIDRWRTFHAPEPITAATLSERYLNRSAPPSGGPMMFYFSHNPHEGCISWDEVGGKDSPLAEQYWRQLVDRCVGFRAVVNASTPSNRRNAEVASAAHVKERLQHIVNVRKALQRWSLTLPGVPADEHDPPEGLSRDSLAVAIGLTLNERGKVDYGQLPDDLDAGYGNLSFPADLAWAPPELVTSG